MCSSGGVVCETLDARQSIPEHWKQSYAFGIVRRGVLIRQRYDAAGRSVTVDAAGPGALVQMGPGYATTRTLVCLTVRDRWASHVASEPTALQDLAAAQTASLDRAERLALSRGGPDVKTKVASLLCTLSDVLAPARGAGDFVQGLNQRDMAALVSVRHESVCRVLKDLERSGLIDREGDELRLVNKSALESL